MRTKGLWFVTVLALSLATPSCSRYAAVHGRIMNPASGKPAEGVTLSLSLLPLDRNENYSARSSADGTFRFESVPSSWNQPTNYKIISGPTMQLWPGPIFGTIPANSRDVALGDLVAVDDAETERAFSASCTKLLQPDSKAQEIPVPISFLPFTHVSQGNYWKLDHYIIPRLTTKVLPARGLLCVQESSEYFGVRSIWLRGGTSSRSEPAYKSKYRVALLTPEGNRRILEFETGPTNTFESFDNRFRTSLRE